MLAVRAGNAAAVDMLLRAGADPGLVDSAGMTALGFAAQGGDELVLRMLLTAGARPDVPDRQGRTPLEQAIASGHGEMATLMLDNPGLSLTGALLRRMWFLAARQGPPGLISALAARGGACALQDAAGLTALDHAAETGNLALLRHCPQGATPPLLLRAVRAGQTGFAMALLAAGVDPDGTSARGNTALLIAAHKGNLLLARALLNRGADVDHRNAAGNSALMLAAENGHEALITMLLDAGADTGLRNKRREKARDIALAAGYPALARRLE
jgi:ankyrin repeat protein